MRSHVVFLPFPNQAWYLLLRENGTLNQEYDMTEFIILPPRKNEGVKFRDNLLGLGLAERAGLMLEDAGLQRASGIEGDASLVIYPGELVGPAVLGKEVGSFHQGSGEISLLTPRESGRPIVLIGRGARVRISGPVDSIEDTYDNARSSCVHRIDIKASAVPVIDRSSRKRARKMLLSSLRKPIDGLICRTLNRPVSIGLSSLLAYTPITPNALSFVTFLTALAGSAMLITHNFIAAAILIHIASVIDGCDGEVARLKYKTSRLGAWLDTVLDDVSTLVFSVALGFGLLTYIGGIWGQVLFAMCIAAAILTLPAYIITYTRLIANGSTDSGGVSWSETTNPSWFRRFLVNYLQPLVKRDGYMFLFVLLFFAGLPWAVAGMYFLGATLTALTIITDKSPSESRYGVTSRHADVVTADVHTR